MNPALILALIGLAKGLTVDAAKEKRQRKLAAETQRYAPFTGLQAQPIQEADPIGSAMQGGFTGYGMSTQEKQQNMQDEILKAYLEKQGGGSGGGVGMSPYGYSSPYGVAPQRRPSVGNGLGFNTWG